MTAVAAEPAAVAPRVDDPGAPPVGRREAALLAVGAVGLAVAVVGTRWGVFTPDTRPDLYQQPGAFLRSTVQAWVPGSSGLGQGNFNAGAAPVAAVVWCLRALGAEPWLAVRLWRLALLLIGAWGIRRYLGALLGHRLTVGSRLLATAFWVANPYVIVAGSTTPILLPYALLPWMLLAFLHGTRSPGSWRWPALFALAFFAQTGLNAGVVPFFGLLALPAHLVHARYAERHRWPDLLGLLLRCGALSVAVSLYWLLPSFLAAGTGAGIASGTEDPVDVARTSSYSETARLLGNWPLYGRAGTRLFLGSYTVYLTSPLVLVATFLVPVGVAVGLWRSRARERLLVVALLATALPVMVGLFPPDDLRPAGHVLLEIFERVPATLAFRTTNKVGAVVVLAETIGLVLAWRAWQARSRPLRRRARAAGVGAVALLLVAISAPLWNGGLYPLGFTIPGTWHQATDDLDAAGDASRVFVLPGGTGGNYRWGMRSPDDLFPSLLERPVAVRNTVVGRGDPAGNLLSAVDTAVAQGAAGERGISTAARYLGADAVLVRNDLLTEEIGGPAPSTVMRQVEADAGLAPLERYGRPGTDTVPGGSGRPSAEERRTYPTESRQPPLATYGVEEPIAPVRLAPTAAQVLVVGDGDALVPLAEAGIVDGTQPLRYVADLDDAEFAAAVAQGGRVVLTDTNRRRAWDINRTTNATSPTLEASDDIDGGNGSTTTRWPDDPDDQTVAEITGGATVGADPPAFGLHPFGRASNALDGDPTTAWITGGFSTARGARSGWTSPRLAGSSGSRSSRSTRSRRGSPPCGSASATSRSSRPSRPGAIPSRSASSPPWPTASRSRSSTRRRATTRSASGRSPWTTRWCATSRGRPRPSTCGPSAPTPAPSSASPPSPSTCSSRALAATSPTPTTTRSRCSIAASPSRSTGPRPSRPAWTSPGSGPSRSMPSGEATRRASGWPSSTASGSTRAWSRRPRSWSGAICASRAAARSS
ncbi:MAG: alpha-(1-_3)-arabinofuranosyltransferase family protein [Acidimicrobiales bacterium]